jgi:phosphatidate cytidylyltransferase
MKKLIERLLIFIIGIPAVVVLVLYLPFHRNLAMNLVIVFFSAAGALEFSAMLEKKHIKIPKVESLILGSLIPLAIMLNISFALPQWIVPAAVMAGAGWALMSRIFSRSAEIDTVTNQIIGGFSLLVYPGFFMYWTIKMNVWENPNAILLFIFITFGSDSIAWLAGTLFGANNRGIITVSPNKSVAGFIGGIFGSVLVAVAAVLFFNGALPFYPETSFSSMVLIAVVIGFFTGIAAILGDLAESAMKRSCDFKDSGNLMLGRGGVLDSIDSIAVAAPVFYMLFSCFFNV